VGRVLKADDVVIYESTVYPGCTEEICVPILERQSSLKYISGDQHDASNGFYCGYSPERINPGDKTHRLPDIKKVTSGSTPETAKAVDALYQEIITAGTHLAGSIKVAEAAKIIENAQRDLNITFVNELSVIFNRVDIDTTEVLQAAATNWNFLPFKPGLVGGHCIGVDPCT
jgi:UDP-N-acetyl-D-galactosamine dehydrogenase